MHGLTVLCAVALLATTLYAQDKAVDIAVAYPSTTMVYGSMDNSRLTKDLELDELIKSLGSETGMPGLDDLLVDRLELQLTPAEIKKLISDLKRSSFGLLDVGVTGPKLLGVFEVADLAAVSRALRQARQQDRATIPAVKDHYGTDIYAVEFPMPAEAIQPGRGMRMNPFGGWVQDQEFWISVFQGRWLVVSNSFTAVTDALDFLSFPDDTVDTLISSARYREAIKEYSKPDALLYVSIESVINAVERLGGDQGRGMMWWQMLGWWFPMDIDDGAAGFMVRLLQYEQFKSASAAMWLDEAKATMRIDVGFAFHNAPGWFDALRIEPQKRPFADMIPSDTTLALTECVKDPMALYREVQEFFVTRARTAGQDELAEAWERWEQGLTAEGANLEEMLGHLAGEQALILLPKQEESDTPFDLQPATYAAMFSVKDCAAAEKYLFENLLPSPLGEFLRPAEGGLTPVEIHNGIEIHYASVGNVAFALVPKQDGSGVLMFGESEAIKRIVDAHTAGKNVATLTSWKAAQAMLPEKSSMGMYLNAGALIKAVGNIFSLFNNAWWWDQEGNDGFDRDDTDKDQDQIPYVSEFFGNTVIAGGAQSEQAGVMLRLVAAGWPARAQMQEMVSHFRDVKRNREVRDDLLKVREGVLAHLAIKGSLPKDMPALVTNGYVRDTEVTQDPFSGDMKLEYKLAEVPETVDSRQAILLAYQPAPGLRGNHLCVLYNQHIVELTPENLTKAIARAKAGESLEEALYAEKLQPLHNQNLRVPRFVEEDWDNQLEVVVIDDQGEEEVLEVEEDAARETTERVLDEKEAAKKQD